MANTIQIKRGQSTNLKNLSLEEGELAVTLDTKELYVGDGETVAKIGGRFATQEEIKSLFESKPLGTYTLYSTDFDGVENVLVATIKEDDDPHTVLLQAVNSVNSRNRLTDLRIVSDHSLLTKCKETFKNLNYIRKIDLTGLDVSNLERIDTLISGCAYLTEIDMHEMTFPKLGIVYQLAYNNSQLKTINLSDVNMPGVTQLTNLIDKNPALTNLTIEMESLPNLNSATDIIRECNALVNLDLSKFDLSHATDITRFIIFASSLKNLTLPPDVSNVKIFDSCIRSVGLTSVDFGTWSNNKITSFQWGFANDNLLTSLDLTWIDWTNVGNIQYLFQNCNKLTEVKVNSTWNNISGSANVSNIYSGASISNVTVVEEV